MIIESSDKKYRVLRELGRGHSGTVYLALDPQDREVAIKCLASQCSESVLTRFRQEFSILRSLKHPHIAQPEDFGYDEGLKRHFFVAEYVQGASLDVVLHTASEDDAARLFAQALRALDYMHRQGVFHCDLKPGNILVNAKGELKIIDFDVAVRGTPAIGGTPSYCAPELLTGDEARPDAKSDLFSLGATFYHCLTRQKPYQARSFSELIVAHGTQRPKLPSQINPRLGTLWDGLLMGLLQTQASQRYSTASAVLQQLYPLLGEKKLAFSEADIAYRLRQHGAPVGKEALLSQIQYFLEAPPEAAPERRLGAIRGAEGLGAGYLAAEIKAMAQLKGLPCYSLDARQESTPQRFPFVWIWDDMDRLGAQRGADQVAALAAKLRELAYKGGAERWFVFAAGFEDLEKLPEELRALLGKAALSLELKPWSLLETKAWLEDIFQTEEIPDFLARTLQEESRGRPRRAVALLRHYLSRGLILDTQGHWRKDLFQPTQLFRGLFAAGELTPEYERTYDSASAEERELLRALALAFGPMPGAFFERLTGRESVHATLRQWVALGLVQGGGPDPYRLAPGGLKEFILGKLSAAELAQAHDRWTALAGDPRFAEFFSEEARLFHRAQGSDAKKSALAWGAWGDRHARHGLWQSAEEAYARAFAAAPEGEAELRFRFAIDRGRSIVQGGRLEEAKEYFDGLLKQFTREKNQNRLFLAKICERLGLIETRRGHHDKAREYFRAGLRCLEPGREPLEQFLGLKNFLAGLDLIEGRYAEAIAAYRETDELAATLPWERRRILTNNDLGAALLQSGDFDAAVAHWEAQLEDLKRREDPNPYVRCLYQLGQAHLDRGDQAKAEPYLTQASRAARNLQNPEMELRIRNALANLWKESKPADALAMYEAALDTAFQGHEPLSIAVVLLNMGFLLAEMGQAARARHCLDQGLRFLGGLPDAERRFADYYKEAREEIARLETALRAEAAGDLQLNPAEQA